MKGIQEQSNTTTRNFVTLDSRRRIALFLYTFHFKSHCKIHRIRWTVYPAVLPSHTLLIWNAGLLISNDVVG